MLVDCADFNLLRYVTALLFDLTFPYMVRGSHKSHVCGFVPAVSERGFSHESQIY